MKKTLKSIKQTHGKEESAKYAPRTLNQVWGETGVDKYGTLKIDDYSTQLEDMNKADLQEHAIKIGLIPVDERRVLTKRLIDEFTRHISAYNIPSQPKPSNVSKLAKDILSEGR